MLTILEDTCKQLLYHQGHIAPDQVDICFEIPKKEWIDSLTQPTISCYLYALEENYDLRQTNLQSSRVKGNARFQMPARRIDLRYMVSVLADSPEDEHQILWRTLATLLKYPQLPSDLLPESFRMLDPPISARVGDKQDTEIFLDLWQALDVPPRPALSYIVTVPLDLDIAFESPLVLTRTTRFKNGLNGDAHRTATLIGGVVRDKAGQPIKGLTVKLEESAAEGVITNAEGQFRLPRVPDGAVRLQILRDGALQKRVEISVPADSYDIVLE